MPDTAKVIQLEPDVQRHVRSRLVRLPAAAHALHEKCKVLLAARLESYFDGADDALFDLADKAASNHEQNLFFDSMREVRVQRKSVEKRFFDSFDEAFARLVALDDRDTLVPEGELSPEALSLVQNEDLEQLVALESTTNRANREYSSTIIRLNSGIRTLVPMPVTEHSNPIGPEVLCTAFMAQVKRLDVDIKAKLVLFKLFDRVVIGELASIYKAIEAILAEHGIQLAAPKAPTNTVRRPPGASVPENSSAPGRTAGRAAGHMVSGGGAGPATPAGDTVGGSSLNTSSNPGVSERELISLLSFVQKLPATAFDGKDSSVEQVLRRVQGHKGRDLELSVVEQETIRLVDMLFDYILRERSLAKPIKDMLLRLQVPVLKVALLDSGFFADKQHVARKLLNEIAVQAVGWQDGANGNTANEPLGKCISRIIERVVNEFDRDVDVFSQAFSELGAFIEKEKRRASVLEKRMVDAEDGKARAEHARRKVALEIDARLAKRQLPASVGDFVRGPWSNVLFVTGLKHGFESTPWAEHLNLLSELIWSVQEKSSAQERQALIIKGPKILKALREGLDEVSYNPFEVSDLLLRIEEAQVARICGEKVKDPANANTATNPAPSTTPATTKVADIQALPSDDPYMISVASFVQGSWFDIAETETQEPLRCRLAAFIKPTGRYIFVNRSGVKVAEKSRQELAMALRSGLLRPVDSGMLFDRALENIVTGLRKGKPKTPLEENGRNSDGTKS